MNQSAISYLRQRKFPRTFSSGSVGFSEDVDSLLSGSCVSIAVSSMSVPSVPVDEGAIGEGSGMSLVVDATGEAWFGNRNWLAGSEDLENFQNRTGLMTLH